MATQIELFDDWHESVIDDAKAIGALIGFDIDRVYFSGFWSQGDGACFEGDLSYRKGGAKAVRSYAPLDTDLHAIADAWQAAQAPLFYRGRARVEHRGRYYHEQSVSFSCEGREGRELSESEEESLIDVARDFMRWTYARLESEYEYRYAWEAARQWQDAGEDMQAARSSAKALVTEMRAAIKAGQRAGDAICKALRVQFRSLADTWESARETRDELANDFAYWQDGKRLDVAQFAAANL